MSVLDTLLKISAFVTGRIHMFGRVVFPVLHGLGSTPSVFAVMIAPVAYVRCDDVGGALIVCMMWLKIVRAMLYSLLAHRVEGALEAAGVPLQNRSIRAKAWHFVFGLMVMPCGVLFWGHT